MPGNEQNTSSLKRKLKAHTIRWTLASLCLGLVLCIPTIGFFELKAETFRVKTLAESVTRAFRQQILNDDVRSAQSQIESVLALHADEFAVVRDAKMNVIYPPSDQDFSIRCQKSQALCLTKLGSFATYMQPIYFDDELKDQIFGYLEIHIRTQFDEGILVALVILLSIVFSVVTFGITTAQNRSLKILEESATDWADHLRTSLTHAASEKKVPFDEFRELTDVIYGIHSEVSKLREASAEAASASTRLTLFRGLNHDLRTPISQVRAGFEILQSRAERTGKLDSTVFAQINGSIETVSALIKQVGEVGLSPAPRFIDSEIIDLEFEVQKYISTLKSESSQKNNRYDLRFNSHSVNPKARIDALQFYRVLDNLVRNAIDFLPENNGTIEISLFDRNADIILAIRDNGSGIPEANLSRIFELDFTTKNSRGTGLGLSIVKQICDDNKAKIHVDSQSGKGSVFQIHFTSSYNAMVVKEVTV